MGHKTGNQIAIIKGHPHFVERMALAPNGNYVAGTARGVISLWNIKTRQEIPSKSFRSGGLYKGIAFSKDSMELYSVDTSFNLTVTDTTKNRPLGIQEFIGHKGNYYANAFSSDRTLVANANSNRRIRLWEINTGKQKIEIRSGFKKPIISLAFSADMKFFAGAGEDQAIRIWDLTERNQSIVLNGHTDRIESIAFSPDGKMLASGSWDGTMRLWDIEAKKQISQRANGRMGGIIEVVFSTDGKTIVSTSTSNQIQLWKVDQNRQMPTVTLSGHNGWIRTLEFSADGKTLASGSDDGTILIWDWDKVQN